MDYMIKLFKYRTAGVREYWIVDYAKDMVMVYNFEQNEMETYTMADKVPVGIYDIVSRKRNTTARKIKCLHY